ncbi:MAG: hypothetical protein HZY78_02500 [Burkholderiaceae bacterium]|nr:MAG: hypothetical protein HZY78_02500 [Burkholderiaceae bacterium]
MRIIHDPLMQILEMKMKRNRFELLVGHSLLAKRAAWARARDQARQILGQRKSTRRHENRLRQLRMGHGKHKAALAEWE